MTEKRKGRWEYFIGCERKEKKQYTAKWTCWMGSPRWGRCVSLCAGSPQRQWDTHGPSSSPSETLLCWPFSALIQLIKVTKNKQTKKRGSAPFPAILQRWLNSHRGQTHSRASPAEGQDCRTLVLSCPMDFHPNTFQKSASSCLW